MKAKEIFHITSLTLLVLVSHLITFEQRVTLYCGLIVGGIYAIIWAYFEGELKNVQP